MGFTPLELPPGVLKRESRSVVAGRWIDTQWVRFRRGRPEKIGGYVAMFGEALEGIVRGMLGWTTVAGSDLIAAGTYIKLYSTSDDVQDITPFEEEGQLTDPFDTVNTSATVTVHHTTHGRVVGGWVFFDNATAVGGITIDGSYKVVTVPTADTYTITHSAPATSTVNGGGGTVDYGYELSPGLLSTSYGLGWGAGTWGLSTWGTPRDVAASVQLESRHWFFAEYGSHLLALPSGGTLYEWNQPNNDERAEAVANAPTARAMFVTSERYPIMLGTATPMTIAWPDQSDITDWTPAADNTARARTLQHGSRLVAGARLGENVNVIWSDTSLYLMQYTGSVFVYDTRHVSDACGLLSPSGFFVLLGTAYWISKAGFLMYQGGLQPIPRSEEIQDFVLDNLNFERVRKIWCGYVPVKNEIWWGYATAGSDEPNRYVAVSLIDYSWTTGTLARSAMSHHLSPAGSPVMAGLDSIIYRHESGLDGNGAAIEAYVQSGIVALKGADNDTEIFGFLPDFERQAGNVDLELNTFETPRAGSVFDESADTIAEDDEVVDLHLAGRYLQIKLTSNVVGGDFRLGAPQLDTEIGGGR